MPLTITGNRQLQIQVRTCALTNSNDPSEAIQKFETFGLSDQTPATGVSGPSGGVIPTTNVTVAAPVSNVAPVASFTFSCVANICSFDGRASTDENAPTLTYSWNFGNGTGAGPVPIRTYTAANTYTVSLTVRDEYGLTSAPATATVSIVEPAANVAPVPVINPPSCSLLVCNISGVGSLDPNIGDAITYLWNFGDGTPTSTTSSAAHTFPAAGTYVVTLTTTDGWLKASIITRSVTVSAT